MSNYRYEDPSGNELEIYKYSDSSGDLRLEVNMGAYETAAIELPKDPAERLKLAEAILGQPLPKIVSPFDLQSESGRKVAAVIYEDELPEVEPSVNGTLLVSNGSSAAIDGTDPVWKWTLGYIAIARHIEARDAETERESEALAEQFHDLYEAWAAQVGWETQEQSRKPWAEVPATNKEATRAVARRAYELGARPAGEEAKR